MGTEPGEEKAAAAVGCEGKARVSRVDELVYGMDVCCSSNARS